MSNINLLVTPKFINMSCRDVEKQFIALTDEYFPYTQQQEKLLTIPYGILFQPMQDQTKDYLSFDLKKVVEKCPKCRAYPNKYCDFLSNGDTLCNFCHSQYKLLQSKISDDVQNYLFNDAVSNDPTILFVVDITRQCGFNLLYHMFNDNVFQKLLDDIPNIKIAFCFYNDIIHYIHVTDYNKIEILTFYDIPDTIPLKIQYFYKTYDILKDAILSDDFFYQLLETTIDLITEDEITQQQSEVQNQTRCSYMAIEFALKLLHHKDNDISLVNYDEKQYGNLFIQFFGFGPDWNTNQNRNMNDYIDGKPNIDSLKANMATKEIENILELYTNNICFDFYFLLNVDSVFIDAINYISLTLNSGSYNIYENENTKFEDDIINSLKQFHKRIFDIQLVVQSNVYDISEIIGTGIQQLHNFTYCCASDLRNLNYAILLKTHQNNKQQQNIAYLQIRFLFTISQQQLTQNVKKPEINQSKQQILRVYTIKLQQTTDDKIFMKNFDITSKLLILNKYIARTSIPQIVQQKDEKISITGGHFDVRNQIETLFPKYIKQYLQTLQMIQLPYQLNYVVRGIYNLLNSNILSPNILADQRNYSIQKIVAGPLYFNINMVKPKVYVCPIHSDDIYISTCNINILEKKSKFALKHNYCTQPICITINKLQTQIVIIIDDVNGDVRLTNIDRAERQNNRLRRNLQVDPEDSISFDSLNTSQFRNNSRSNPYLFRRYSNFFRNSITTKYETDDENNKILSCTVDTEVDTSKEDEIDLTELLKTSLHNVKEVQFEYLINDQNIDQDEIHNLQQLLNQNNIKNAVHYLHNKFQLDTKCIQILTTTNDLMEIQLLLFENQDNEQLTLEEWLETINAQVK